MKQTKIETNQPSQVLLVKHADGKELKVTIPTGGRFTFGPVIPNRKHWSKPEPILNLWATFLQDIRTLRTALGSPYNEHGYALRIYSGKSNDSLIAVFCDVRDVRDVNLPVSKLVVREGGNELWKSDEDGYEVSKKVKQERTFIDANLLNG
jgi:hypothetical protein